MRRILIGASRDIEYDMRNDFFAHLQTLPLALLPGAPHRRPDVAGHQRPERRPDDDRPGGDVLGRTPCSAFVVAIVLMLAIDARLTLIVAHPAAVRVDLGEVLRRRHPQAVRADSGAALRHQRGRAGGAVRRPRRARLPAGGRRDRALPPGERGISAPQPAARSSSRGCSFRACRSSWASARCSSSGWAAAR